MRIDRAIRPPGLIRNGAALSLFSTARGLYAIRTGRGWRVGFEPRGRLNRFVARRVVERMQRKLDRAEQALSEHDLDGELERRRGSVFVPRAELTDLEFRAERLPELSFGAEGKRYRFTFEAHRAAEAEAFVATLGRSRSRGRRGCDPTADGVLASTRDDGTG